MSAEIDALLKADEDRRHALLTANLALLDARLSDDLVLVHTSGALDSKQSLMKKIEDGRLRYTAIDNVEFSVCAVGAAGVTTTLSLIKVEVSGVAKELRCRTVSVWVNQQSEWVLRHYQNTAVITAERTSIQ